MVAVVNPQLCIRILGGFFSPMSEMWGLLNCSDTSLRFVTIIGLGRFTGCCVEALRGGGQPSSWASPRFSEPSCLNPIVLKKFHVSARWSYWRTESH